MEIIVTVKKLLKKFFFKESYAIFIFSNSILI
jgi:hypothetical protein